MEIRFKKLAGSAKTPTRGTSGSAGYDLYVSRKEWLEFRAQDETEDIVVAYHSDIAVEIPEGHVGLLFPRSSVSKTGQIMCNSVGVIDSDYRGEISARYTLNYNSAKESYCVGDKFAQLIVMPYPAVKLVESETLSDTDRGDGGYGSTGK